jgi:hypothetical protein
MLQRALVVCLYTKKLLLAIFSYIDVGDAEFVHKKLDVYLQWQLKCIVL